MDGGSSHSGAQRPQHGNRYEGLESCLLIEAMGAPWGMDMDSEEKAFYASHSSLQGAVAMMVHCEHWEGDLLIRHLDV